jgi:RNA polymerase sigma-70 factor (ECF subfamily)
MDVERQWVTAATRGDQRAFAHLVDAYKVPVYNLCYRMLGNTGDAEDAAQETFVRLYTHLRSYNPQQKLSSWILAVASHYCIDRLRRRRIKWLSLDEVLPLPAASPDEAQPEDRLMERETCAEIRHLLQTLPAEDRLVIALRYWQDLSYEEIARVVGATESAVKSRLHRARRILADGVRSQGAMEVATGSHVQNGKRVMTNAVL